MVMVEAQKIVRPNDLRRLATQEETKLYKRYYDHIVEDAGKNFIRNMYALIMRVYEKAHDGKYMTLDEAKEFIPLRPHGAAMRRYFVKADAHGFLKLVSGFHTFEQTGELVLIMPGPKMDAFIHGDVAKLLEKPRKNGVHTCFFHEKGKKKEEGFRWTNPDGSMGGWVAKTARVHKTATVEFTAVVTPGQVVGPGKLIKGGEAKLVPAEIKERRPSKKK